MTLFLILLLLLSSALFLFINQPKFGQKPSGKRLETILKSPNYRNNQFQNLSETPTFANGENFFSVLKKFFFNKSKRNKPSQKIPSQKTDLHSLHPQENVLVWFGHSSYFMQLDGKTILVDPVFSGLASPIPGTTTSFDGSDNYNVSDFPKIDYLFISHDHWDHLDYETVLKLQPKVKTIITGLGTGAHLEYWGFDPESIIERDWNQEIILDIDWLVTITPARHFSGRALIRNKALWVSFVVETPTKKLFLGGDSGYDTHFARIGAQHGPFDLAILECGQYNSSWKNIHLMPDEMLQVASDLNANVMMPVHWGKFALALHAWDEPIRLVTQSAMEKNQKILTPSIGEKINLDALPIANAWWENVD